MSDDGASDQNRAIGECGVDPEASDGHLEPAELGFDPEATDRPVLVWDGTCGFCRRSVLYLEDRVGDRIHYVPYQHVHRYFDDIDEGDFEESVHLVEPDGLYYSGAEAVFRALEYAPDGGTWRKLYDNVPGVAPVSERGYRFVAEHRPLVDKVTRWLFGEDLRSSRFDIARWLFLRLLALVVVIAFVSLGLQVSGLMGSSGIVPAAETVERLQEATANRDGSIFWQMPTLFWWMTPTDAALTGLSTAGALLGVALMFGVWPRAVLVCIWAAYLSFMSVGGPFLGYQWDALLLETVFLTIFVAPGAWLAVRPGREPSRLGIFLFQWLAFRLMFMSGAVKLASGDPTWQDGTALTYHFWTQPIPSWASYYVHQLPEFVLWSSTHATMVVELALPFLVFGPRRLRRFAAYSFIGLQVVILATGNYGFFNILSVAIFVLLIEDRIWRRLLPAGFVDWVTEKTEPGWRAPWFVVRRTGLAVVVAFVVGVTGHKMMRRLSSEPGSLGVPSVVTSVVDATAGFRTLNNYGLFADMTTVRPEILVQGSRDGENWKTYDFRWKPDATTDRPGFVEPHMPRVDWQMWFQALRIHRAHERAGRCGHSRWFLNLQRALLEGREPVLSLLADNPFEQRPPTYVRTVVYDYRFAGPKAEQGEWWERSNRRRPCPVLTLRNGELTRASNR
jgi:predicted DCC family thiol-disulfide oxidoreductase YuxK